MADPPFPVPRGMQWDRDKRRFFKAPPALAKVAPASSQGAQDQLRRKQKQPSHVAGDLFGCELDHAAATTRSRPFHNLRRGMHGAAFKRQSHAFPTLAQCGSQSRHLVAAALSTCKLQCIVSLELWYTMMMMNPDHDGRPARRRRAAWSMQGADIHSLASSTALGALLFLNNWRKEVIFVDLASVTKDGSAGMYIDKGDRAHPDKVVSHYMPSTFRGSIMQSTHTQYDSADCALYNDIGRRLDDSKSYAIDGHWLVRWSDNYGLLLQYLATDTTSHETGRCITHTRLRLAPKEASEQRNADAIFSVREVSGRQVDPVTSVLTVAVVSVQRNVTVYCVTGQDVLQRTRVRPRRFKQESDILCHDVAPSGRVLFVGHRNGTVAALTITGRPCKADAKTQWPHTRLSGPITNLKSLYDDEVLVADMSGQLLLMSVTKGAFRVVRFFCGHENTWTLHPPMAVDETSRVFALAGQDRRVRIWSLDRQDPLSATDSGEQQQQQQQQRGTVQAQATDVPPSEERSETLSLASSTANVRVDTEQGVPLSKMQFSEPISGLAFVPRAATRTTEGLHNNAFLPRSVPALAVTCGAHRIALFE